MRLHLFWEFQKRGSFGTMHRVWAYSIAVERLHGMEEVGVRLPVGPQGNGGSGFMVAT